MANGKFNHWLTRDGLEKLTNWAMKGCTDAQLANNMGISISCYYKWANDAKCVDIFDAIKKGREMSIVIVENTAFKVALGLVEEEVAVKVRDKDGGERVEMRKRRPLPNTTMLIFLLKNKAGYRDNPDYSPDDDEGLAKAREILGAVPSVID